MAVHQGGALEREETVVTSTALGKQDIACSADLPESLCTLHQCLRSPPALCCVLKLSWHIPQLPRPHSDRMGGRQMVELGNWDEFSKWLQEPSQNFDISWVSSCVAETSGIYGFRKPQSDWQAKSSRSTVVKSYGTRKCLNSRLQVFLGRWLERITINREVRVGGPSVL